MWQVKQTELLRREIKVLLAPLSSTADLGGLIQKSINDVIEKSANENKRNHPWFLLPLVVCESISGHYKQSLPAAVAFQLFIVAGNIFDDIEDADSPQSLSARYSPAIAINVATTLVALAEKEIIRLKTQGVAELTITQIQDVFNSSFIDVCIGQHLDLSLIQGSVISEEIYLKIIELKTGSTMKCACHVGALLATNDIDLINLFIDFGRSLGMASQIANDIQGILSGNDIQRRKVTLPIIYALSQTDTDTHYMFESTFIKKTEDIPDVVRTKDRLLSIGAIHYAMTKMELCKQLALDVLSKIEIKIGKQERLRLFLK